MNKQLVFAFALIACNAFGMQDPRDLKVVSPIKKGKHARKGVHEHECLADALESRRTSPRARRNSLNRLVGDGHNAKTISKALFTTQEDAQN